MLAFFNMVASAFGLFFGFFNKFSGFSNTFSLLTNLRLLSRKILFSILMVMVVALVSLLLAFFYFTIESIVTVYNLISALLVRITTVSNAGGPTTSLFYLFLNATGVVTGLQTIFPFIASALTFRLMKFLYLNFIELIKPVVKIFTHSTFGITAA